MPIERDIHDLLHHHDCVIVPAFGGFLAHYRPARLDEAQQQLHPPARELSFNRNLVRNDGLLADQLARRTGVAFDEASGSIAVEVASWQDRISRDRRLELPRIGTFFTDREGNLQFDPDKRVNYLRDAYGLRPVVAVPLPRKEMPVTDPRGSELPGTPPNTAEGWPWLRAAAIVTGVIALAGVGYLVGTARPDLQWSALMPWRFEPSRYMVRSGDPDAATSLDTAFHVPVPDGFGIVEVPLMGVGGAMTHVDRGAAPEPPTTVEEREVPVEEERDRERFHVIGGCFSVGANARRFVAQMRGRGHRARIIDRHRGLYRVAVDSYADHATATAASDRFEAEGLQGAWILAH